MAGMIDDLLQQGIKLPRHTSGNQKTICPRCSASRKNKKDPCLSVTIESDHAVYNCHHCFWKGSAGNVSARRDTNPEPKAYKRPAASAVAATGFPAAVLQAMLDRKITQAVIDRNRLFWDANRKAISFPYYENGELINVKYRTLDKKFQLEGGAKLILYGLDDVKGQDEIIIVEGEFDKLALEVCGIKNVVSVPNGAPARIKEGDDLNDKAFNYLLHSEELFKKAKRVYIAVDDDPAGKNLEYELVRRIGAHKCFIVKFGKKDANDSLIHLGEDVTLDAIKEARPQPIKGLYRISDFDKQLMDYFDHGMKSGVSTGFSNLDKKFTIKPGETTVVTGIPNMGKSELVDALMINVAKSENWKTTIFSPEHKKEAHVTKLIEKVTGESTSPKSADRITAEKYMDGAAWLDRYFTFIVADDYDEMPTIDWVLEKATAAVYREGIKMFLIDPWNELQLPEPKRGVSETDHIGQNIAKVMRWGKRYDVHCFIIAHPAKILADKDGKQRVPGLYDIHGSAHWVNKPDNGIVVHISEDASMTTDVHIKKVRDKHVGGKGKISLSYNIKTGEYSVPKYTSSDDEGSGEDMQTYDAYQPQQGRFRDDL